MTVDYTQPQQYTPPQPGQPAPQKSSGCLKVFLMGCGVLVFLFAAFCVALIRPRIWRYSGWTGRAVILTLVSLGVCHTVWKIWTAIKLLPEDQTGARVVHLPLLGKALSGRRAVFLIGLGAIGCGLVGTLVGMSLSDLLSIAMPRFFDQSIRLDLLLYPWVMVLFLNACHSVSQRLDI